MDVARVGQEKMMTISIMNPNAGEDGEAEGPPALLDPQGQTYIPAVFLVFKAIAYTGMVPIALTLHKEFTLFIISIFVLFLLVDHIYFALPNKPGLKFIDSTSICWDIMVSHLFMINGMIPTIYTTFTLFSWGVGGSLYNAMVRFRRRKSMHLDVQKTKLCLHMATFFFILLVVLSCKKDYLTTGATTTTTTTTTSIALQKIEHESLESIPFFARSIFYTVLTLVDSYSFRPALLQERERLFFCIYGAVLFSPQALCTLGLFVILLSAQLFSIFQWMSSTSSRGADHENVQEGRCIRGYNDTSPELARQEKSESFTPNPLVFNTGKEGVVDQAKQLLSFHNEMHTVIPTFPAAVGISIADPVDSDVMEAFRIAKQQYSAYHGGKTN